MGLRQPASHSLNIGLWEEQVPLIIKRLHQETFSADMVPIHSGTFGVLLHPSDFPGKFGLLVQMSKIEVMKYSLSPILVF